MDRGLEEPHDDWEAPGQREPLAQRHEDVEPVALGGRRQAAELPVGGEPRVDADDLDSVDPDRLAHEHDELVLAAGSERLDGVELAAGVPLPFGRDHEAVEADARHAPDGTPD
jgi:hypothetical protein